MRLGFLDVLTFVTYFVGVVVFGVVVAARSKLRSSEGYFLAAKQLPWYAVGASFICSNISTEHFIGMVGAAFLYGMSLANWCWLVIGSFSFLIWIFLPFYMRGNVSTMPEFLVRRYNPFCRYVYAIAELVGMVVAMLGGIMFAGAKALHQLFPAISVPHGILILAISAGVYTVYGGLISVVWADLVQYCLLMLGGLVVSLYGLHYAGGFHALAAALPEKMIMFYPSTHELVPWTGLLLGIPTVGLWYACANQFMVQRCLGARSEWDARIGIVMAGFSQILLPLIVVVPGIVAFYLFQSKINDGDQSWPFMVKEFLPTGLIGLVLAGLASAIMGSMSGIINSSATIFTLDLYRPILRPKASDRELRLLGRISGAIIMTVGVVLALIMANKPGLTVFGIIQSVFYYMAGPISAVFLFGVLFKRITPAAAAWALGLGFLVYLPFVEMVLFKQVAFLRPYDSFMHHTFVVWIMSTITLFVISAFTRPKSDAELVNLVWTKSALSFLPEDRERNRGLRSLQLWWGLFAGTILVLYAITEWMGSKTKIYEAESTPYAVTGGAARMQVKGNLSPEEKVAMGGFNMWTGQGQVLFIPSAAGGSITWQLPVKAADRYQLGALVTTGPDYGAFSAKVNRKAAGVTFPTLRTQVVGRAFTIRTTTTLQFNSNRWHGSVPDAPLPGDPRSPYVMQRIDLGKFDLAQGDVPVTLTALGAGGRFGVDAWFLTRVGGK